MKCCAIWAPLNIDREIELIERPRAELGPDIAIRVDANEGYDLPSETIRATRATAAHDIAYMKPPVADPEDMAVVAEPVVVPVMADEGA